jgi:hypothetical protein
MSPDEVDAVYLALCTAVDEAGEQDTPEYLTRAVLLLALEIGDHAVVLRRLAEGRVPDAARAAT